jgi:hypothetical protein
MLKSSSVVRLSTVVSASVRIWVAIIFAVMDVWFAWLTR